MRTCELAALSALCGGGSTIVPRRLDASELTGAAGTVDADACPGSFETEVAGTHLVH